MGVLTGDFVFVGDVGRPDLLEKAAKVANTMEAGARTLFASLQRFRALPDHMQLWPGHGAGSACGAQDLRSAHITYRGPPSPQFTRLPRGAGSRRLPDRYTTKIQDPGSWR